MGVGRHHILVKHYVLEPLGILVVDDTGIVILCIRVIIDWYLFVPVNYFSYVHVSLLEDYSSCLGEDSVMLV